MFYFLSIPLFIYKSPLFIYKSPFLINIFHPYLSLLIYLKLSEIFEDMRFLKIEIFEDVIFRTIERNNKIY